MSKHPNEKTKADKKREDEAQRQIKKEHRQKTGGQRKK